MKKRNYLTRNSCNGWSYISSLLSFLLLSAALFAQPAAYNSPQLNLQPLAPDLYVHETFLQTETWGKVGCNGMIYISGDSAIIFDTPSSDSASIELLQVVQKKWKLKVKAVVINHYHNDCLGGLQTFHAAGIRSYANQKTIELAKEQGVTALPQQGFTDSLNLYVNGRLVVNRFFGEGHTRDNIVSYIPSINALFGGCLIKALKAGYGHLGDANINTWSATVAAIRRSYPALKIVVPGHGPSGTIELLKYTEELFSHPEKISQ